jgi:hypothetical protein
MVEILMRREQEISFLREIIKTLLGVDVKTNRTRVRDVVNAKMIYSWILHNECGMGCSVIAKSLVMNHATVLHYFKTVPWYLKTDLTLHRNYERIKSEFLQEYDPVYYMSEIELKKELISLRIENKDLSSRLSKLTTKLESLKKESNKLPKLIKIVKERTRPGTEEMIAHRMNQFYNGVYDK